MTIRSAAQDSTDVYLTMIAERVGKSTVSSATAVVDMTDVAEIRKLPVPERLPARRRNLGIDSRLPGPSPGFGRAGCAELQETTR